MLMFRYRGEKKTIYFIIVSRGVKVPDAERTRIAVIRCRIIFVFSAANSGYFVNRFLSFTSNRIPSPGQESQDYVRDEKRSDGGSAGGIGPAHLVITRQDGIYRLD